MKKYLYILLGMLIFSFALNITGFSINCFCLVESHGINSVDMLWWIIFVVSSIIFFIKEKSGKTLLTAFLAIWAIIQYYSHWNYTIFGAIIKNIRI